VARGAGSRRGFSKGDVKVPPPRWRTDEELEKLIESTQLSPAPKRFVEILPGRPHPGSGVPGAITAEDIENYIEKEFQEVANPRGRKVKRHFDPHMDNPLEKGIDVMLRVGSIQRMICCRGCGIPMQTHDPNNVGYVPFPNYLKKWSMKLHRRLLCSRCLELDRGLLRPVVRETLGPSAEEGAERLSDRFKANVVPAEVLERQLASIKTRRCFVVYLIDICDINGSFWRNIRKIVGQNPVMVIGTKADLLPPRTDKAKVAQWLSMFVKKQGLRCVGVALVSSATGAGVRNASWSLVKARQGLDVFVIGAANAGKSSFITKLMEDLEWRYPSGNVETVERPLISSTPGTTLGIIPLRVFRKTADSEIYALLYDTPGVHQPKSMQNLLPIDVYDRVQPTKAFSVFTVRPASDLVAELRKVGTLLNATNLQVVLNTSIRYIWGIPGEKPVAAIEVAGPLSSALQLSFCGVSRLAVTCEPSWLLGYKTPGEFPPEPDGLKLARIVYVKAPEKLSQDGDVLADVALAGFGWVAVSATPISTAAVSKSLGFSTFTVRVYGPPGLMVKIGDIPLPVGGLPGKVMNFTEENFETFDEEDADEAYKNPVGQSEEEEEEKAQPKKEEKEEKKAEPVKKKSAPSWLPTAAETKTSVVTEVLRKAAKYEPVVASIPSSLPLGSDDDDNEEDVLDEEQVKDEDKTKQRLKDVANADQAPKAKNAEDDAWSGPSTFRAKPSLGGAGDMAADLDFDEEDDLDDAVGMARDEEDGLDDDDDDLDPGRDQSWADVVDDLLPEDDGEDVTGLGRPGRPGARARDDEGDPFGDDDDADPSRRRAGGSGGIGVARRGSGSLWFERQREAPAASSSPFSSGGGEAPPAGGRRDRR